MFSSGFDTGKPEIQFGRFLYNDHFGRFLYNDHFGRFYIMTGHRLNKNNINARSTIIILTCKYKIFYITC
jgi:hypothetical protein